MSIQFQPTALVGAIALALGFSSSSFANESPTAQAKLNTIVVTASRSEQNIKDVPVRMSVFSEKDIHQSPISNLGDLLRKDASLNIVQSGGIGQTTSGFIRGTDSKHLLFLKDGVSLNTALDGGANIPYIDLSDLERIEILKGPASVQYGTDAIGGVINVITKTHEKNATFITTEVGENKTYKAVIGADLKDSSGFYAQVRAQNLESDGTPVTDKSKQNKAFNQRGYSTKIGLDTTQIKSSLSFSENQGINEFNYSSQDFLNRVLIASTQFKLNPKISLNAQYSNFEDELISQGYGYLFYTERDEADLHLNWKMTDHQNVLIGSSLNYANIESYSINGQKQNLDTIGYYIQHKLDTEQLHTQVGLRLEDHEQFGSHIVGQVAGRFDLTPTTSIYSNIGTGFKAPTGNQLFYASTFIDTYAKPSPITYITTGNPNLKPEESISYEMGIDQIFGQGFTGSASIFETRAKNLIDYVSEWDESTQTSDSSYINTSKAKMTGAEIGLKWQHEDLFFNTQYAYVKTQNLEEGYELARRPRQSFTTTIGLENENYGLSASLIAKSTSKISAAKNSKELPGYATVDLNGYWNINSNIKLFSNIKNIGDVKFKTASYGGDEYYINGGRLASAGVTFKY